LTTSLSLLISSNGQWYLTLGSFWTGIKQVRIDSNGKLKDSSVTAIASRTGTTAIEAPVIFANGGYFYAFTSWDKCCSGTSSTYNIRVGRSTR
jgi:arabinan endo-1,5-alpha-L-arabinosidase